MSLTSMFAPSAKSIQQEYVDKRMRALHKNDDARTDKVKAVIVEQMRKNGVGRHLTWHDCYKRISDGLRDADLTINIDAVSWFLKANTYPTYASMYQRALNKDGELRMKSDDLNPAAIRMIADDLTSLPEEWATAYPWTQRKRLYNALNATGANSNAVGSFGARDKIDPSNHPKLQGDHKKGFDTTNKKFKAKAKEVFAALNYGRRQHGANTTYGYSYLVLNPELKKRAIYYPCDTFYSAHKGTGQQATYNTIGALIGDAAMADEIWHSCYSRRIYPDTGSGMMMIEAHIHKEVKIAEDVQALVLSRKQKDGKAPFSENEWRDAVKNATKWCEHNKVRLVFSGH